MYWYEEEIKRIERMDKSLVHESTVLFYGSSSIRLWEGLSADFPEYNMVNLGFGGSTLAACTWFFERVMQGYHPRALVVYAGDNDLGDGRHPEEIFIFFQLLMTKASAILGDIPCFFVSLKPSPVRWEKEDQFKYTNNLIENEIIKYNANWKFINVFKRMLDKSGKPMANLYAPDGLHLGPFGYELWREAIAEALAKVL